MIPVDAVLVDFDGTACSHDVAEHLLIEFGDPSWPEWDEALTVEHIMEIPVQVNGKTRSRVQVSRGAGESQVLAAALRDPVVAKFVDGKAPVKVIYVQDRLLNLVL